MNQSQYQDVLNYISRYWDQVAFKPGQRPRGGLRNIVLRTGSVNLPKIAFAPNHTYFAGTQFYWDSYFTVIGLVDEGQGALARGMVDNLCYLYEQFGLVPARNTRLSRGRTQPPFLTRMAWEVYESGAADKDWMNRVMSLAASEYENVWHGPRRFVPEAGLNRYNPPHPRQLTVYESGWDKSTRFASLGSNLLPVDLNAFLYQYEDDLYNWTKLQNMDTQQTWKERMDKRRVLIAQYFWDEETGFFYDYNLEAKNRTAFRTLAGYMPLWAGVASPNQAKRAVEHLQEFEHDYGLAATQKTPWKRRQWDYPNGWAPLHYLVITALRRYGFNEDALRLTKKWLNLNQAVFRQTGVLWEKYDVVQGTKGLPGRDDAFPGFAWTNGVFLRLLKQLTELA